MIFYPQMPTKRRRQLTIEITDPDEPHVDPSRLETALAPFATAIGGCEWRRIDTAPGPPVLRLDAEGPFSTRDAQKIARLIRAALDNQGHAIIWLSEDYTTGPQQILRLEIVSHVIESESGAEE